MDNAEARRTDKKRKYRDGWYRRMAYPPGTGIQMRDRSYHRI